MESSAIRAMALKVSAGILLAAALATGAGAQHSDQDLDISPAGLAVTPPAGYVATSGTPGSPGQAAINVTKPTEQGTGCIIAFEAMPGFDQFTQSSLNRQTDQPDWQRFYREGLGEFYDIERVDVFEHAGVRGAVVLGVSRTKPAVPGWIADLPSLIFMFYTPKGLSRITCVAAKAVFAARRGEFEAVVRGVALPR
jgi:hypothetical protein